jgi:hypothetical protein
MSKEILVYSTVAGELVTMVQKGVPLVLVSWEDYSELKKEKDVLENTLKTLQMDKS